MATLKTYKGFAGENAGLGVGVVEGAGSGRGIWLRIDSICKREHRETNTIQICEITGTLGREAWLEFKMTDREKWEVSLGR